jgi:[histone H3]-trimethyl-L-lysine4 demethylase
LPFQPDEEEVLDNIISQASAFRDFLQGFTNAACTTTEEVPTLIFYLRKIEGAEVLLAYETNFFRQEIHKWAAVAPDPPPILEQSLSTRKPRPTKQQKIMAQFGVDRPEDLPAHLRAKQNNTAKRRSLESQTTQLTLQPSSQFSPDLPGDNRASVPGGNEPTLSSVSTAQTSQPYPYSLSTSDASTPFAAEPSSSAFLPHVAVHSPSFPPRSPPSHQDLDQSLFSPTFNRDHNDESSGVDLDGNNPFTSSPRQNLDDVFADLTNQDVDTVVPMENTHANEALEALDVSISRDSAGPDHEAETVESQDGIVNGETRGGEDGDPSLGEDY